MRLRIDGLTLSAFFVAGFASPALAQDFATTPNTYARPVAPIIGCPPGGGTCAGPVSATNPLPSSDVNNVAFAGAITMTVGTVYAYQRSVGVLATAAGNVVFQFPDASTLTLPVYIGWQTFPFECTEIVSAGTTATATYYNMK